MNQHKKLVLSGVGGLGKTELTKRFLDRLVNTEVITSGIEEIAWIPYDNQSICISIQRALRLQCDPSEVWQIIQEKATQLQNRLLLVIDNVENPEEDEYLKKISVLQCNILVTSRQKELQGFSDILYLQPLSELSCRKLFYKHYQFDERDDDVLNDIISLTAHLTIMIVFIAKDAETKFQLCNNLACVLNSETEEEIEYKESLFDLVKDDAAVLSYAIHYLDDWLPDSAE